MTDDKLDGLTLLYRGPPCTHAAREWLFLSFNTLLSVLSCTLFSSDYFPYFCWTTHSENSFLFFVTIQYTPKPLFLWMSLWYLFHRWDFSILAFMRDIKNLLPPLLITTQDCLFMPSKACYQSRSSSVFFVAWYYDLLSALA